MAFFMSLVLGFCLALTSCSSRSNNSYQGYLKLSMATAPQTFNPALVVDAGSAQLMGWLFEGLTRVGDGLSEAQPLLAEKWTMDETGCVWQVHLRPNILWSDGVELTADDVVFTYNDILYNEKIPVPARSAFLWEGRRMAVARVDAHTVQFTLPHPVSSFLRLLSQPILPCHVLLPHVQQGTFMQAWAAGAAVGDVVGTGPFVLESYVPGERLLLKKNMRYWQKDAEGSALPYLDGIVLFVMANANSALLCFQRGELDIVGLRGEDKLYLEGQAATQRSYDIRSLGPSWSSYFLALQLNAEALSADSPANAWFADVRFRQALAYAMDRRHMIDHIFCGEGFPQYGPLTLANEAYYNHDIPRYEHDMEKAKALLAEAGFVRKGEVLQDAGGHPVAFEVLVSSESEEGLAIVSLFQEDLAQLGIRLSVNALPFGVLVQKVMGGASWQAVMLGLTGSADPLDGSNVWLSSGPLHLWNLHGPQLYSWEKDIDALFAQAIKEMDPVRRKALYDRWQILMGQQLPLLYTITPAVLFAVQHRVRHLQPSALLGILDHIETVSLSKHFRNVT